MRIFILLVIILKLIPSAEAEYGLDGQIMKERLRKIYGDFSVKAKGEWQVSYGGKVVTWKWSEKGWSCPSDPTINCREWVPTSFKWWVESRGWLDRWSPVSRIGFELGKAKVEGGAGQTPIVVPVNPENMEQSAVDHGHEKSDEPDILGGKKWASEVWEWKDTKGAESKLYISLRDQRIERIDSSDSVEYVDWKDRPGRSTPDLTKVVVEKSGMRVVFSKPDSK
jgi:hypothetical protein